MERFSEWSPTPYDSPRTRVRDASGDWIDVGDWRVLHFGHWGPGWFEILIVRPGSTAGNR